MVDGRSSSPSSLEEPKSRLADVVRRWPKQTFCIIGNEFCERFSYYGMRSVLTIYLMNILLFSKTEATELYHSFTFLCYATPLFGSMLADGYIGKYWTIVILSVVYAGGQIILSIASSFQPHTAFHPWLDLLGLFVIGVGTGGIKPCVSAFGGDQFDARETRMISLFFSVFYFTINAGSTVSMFLTPQFRAISCLGQESCFPLAFGIPAVLMIIATVLFLLGTFYYTRNPPKENTILRVFTTVKSAIKGKLFSKEKKKHWLDHALDEHSCLISRRCRDLAKGKKIGEECEEKRFVESVKGLVRVLIMMTPFPMFWALYNQQGSRWTIQALAMDGHVAGGIVILPEQMQVINAILIMTFIPLFQFIVYPAVEKCGIRTTSLRRMCAGLFVAVFAFIICGFLQLSIDATLPHPPPSGHARLTISNSRSCPSDISFADSAHSLSPGESLREMITVPSGRTSLFISSSDSRCPSGTVPFQFDEGKTYFVVFFDEGFIEQEISTAKPSSGKDEFILNAVLATPCPVEGVPCSGAYTGKIALCPVGSLSGSPCNPHDEAAFRLWPSGRLVNVTGYEGKSSSRQVSVYEGLVLRPGEHKAHLVKEDMQTMPIPQFDVNVQKMGGAYWKVVDGLASSAFVETVQPNKVSILWQIPQYVVITAAEVLFAITGLEFAYSEAAPSLKSFVQAMQLFAVGGGDVIIIVLSHLDIFPSVAVETFCFSLFMFITAIIFILISVFYYEYADYSHIPDVELEDMDENERSNAP